MPCDEIGSLLCTVILKEVQVHDSNWPHVRTSAKGQSAASNKSMASQDRSSSGTIIASLGHMAHGIYKKAHACSCGHYYVACVCASVTRLEHETFLPAEVVLVEGMAWVPGCAGKKFGLTGGILQVDLMAVDLDTSEIKSVAPTGALNHVSASILNHNIIKA